MYTCSVFPQTQVLGLCKENSEEAQQSNPPTFMLGSRRELNTERLEGRAGCSEECRGLAKLTQCCPEEEGLELSTAAACRTAIYTSYSII